MTEFLGMCMLKVQFGLESLFKKEDGEVNIVAMVVLIGIAVALAVIFREQIQKLLLKLFDSIFKNAATAIQ